MAETENQDPNAAGMDEEQDDVAPEEKFDLLDADTTFKEEVTDVFDMFDKEKAGTTEATNLGTILRWLKFNPTNPELKEWTEKYDPNQMGTIPLNAVYRIVN
jgi:Ca2+-binding EF-hand superfamily protein